MSAKLYQPWLDKAEADLALARIALASGPDYIDHACFLAQQCIEKALKGYLLDNSGSYPRTHTLIQLLSECIAQDTSFSSFRPDCLVVDRYYTPTRYPDSTPPYSLNQNDANNAIATADNLLNFVKTKI